MIRAGFLVFLLLGLSAVTEAQELPAEDMALVFSKDFQANISERKKYEGEGNSTEALQTKTRSALARYNPVSLTLRGTMALYQNVLSPQLSRSCPYEITCSNFSKHAIHEFGMVKGIFLSADRVLRCNRIGLLDVHPLSINERTGRIGDPLEQYGR